MAPRLPVTASALAEESIPTYRIDLSLPPAERYVEVATDFAPRMKMITPLFDEVLVPLIPWAFMRRFIEFVASLILRRVYSSEETQELKGISRASGLDMYFLVALNVLLDSFLGCTSGGVLTQPQKGASSSDRNERMMHFRTLDWGMSSLRSVLVVLEFVRSKSAEPEKVIARTVTYAGFVGVLTGVRQNLSLSLNFRPNHNCSTFSLLVHQTLIIFGIRPSIASVLRNAFFLLEGSPLPVDDLAKRLTETLASPCYLICSTPSKTIVVEKDLLDGKIRSATDFIVHTNHDIKSDDPSDPAHSQKEKSSFAGMESLLDDSETRRDCVCKKWNSLVKRQERKMIEEGREGAPVAVKEKTLRGWVKAFPTMNECTHFGCIMDPALGTIRWIERGVEVEEEESEANNADN
ncbi:hypothetical protein OIDMADRAFT_23483 [Oidiodendron maius Zn]|uniref:ceramidase n=1 Tax=Oidiodendron maius (strain Zn) TaxID=913774 RepID=A0A0C3E2Z6_OIDMZ|nr:hypothetical protein OIDMADRAFT_23483 [Oidiodendron maius Zn]